MLAVSGGDGHVSVNHVGARSRSRWAFICDGASAGKAPGHASWFPYSMHCLASGPAACRNRADQSFFQLSSEATSPPPLERVTLGMRDSMCPRVPRVDTFGLQTATTNGGLPPNCSTRCNASP